MHAWEGSDPGVRSLKLERMELYHRGRRSSVVAVSYLPGLAWTSQHYLVGGDEMHILAPVVCECCLVQLLLEGWVSG